MRKLAFWILVLSSTLVFCVSTSPFCNVSQELVTVRSCDEVSGPEVNCSLPVVNHLMLLKKTHESYLFQYNRLSPTASYYNYKLIKNALRDMLKEMQIFHAFLKETNTQYHNYSGEYCVSMLYLEKYISEMTKKASNNSYEDWIDYYFPVIAGLELLLGILGNVMIVVIYARHEDMRTGANKVILNLAIGDMLLLITNTVIFYIRYRWLPVAVASAICYVMSYFRTACIASSIYSMVVLSLLRFLVTSSTPGSKTQDFLKKYAKIPLLLVLVWILAGLTGSLDAFNATRMCEFTKGTARQYIKFVFMCLLPLLVIGAFSVATSRIMQKSAQQFPGEQTPGMLREIHARQRGAKVILCLVMVFCVTYLPLNIYFLAGKNYGPSDHLYVFSTQLLIPLNSCLNPLALCIGSGKFRMHFNNYLCKCCFWNKSSKAVSQAVELEPTPDVPRS